jgi:hypothetical protein
MAGPFVQVAIIDAHGEGRSTIPPASSMLSTIAPGRPCVQAGGDRGGGPVSTLSAITPAVRALLPGRVDHRHYRRLHPGSRATLHVLLIRCFPGRPIAAGQVHRSQRGSLASGFLFWLWKII